MIAQVAVEMDMLLTTNEAEEDPPKWTVAISNSFFDIVSTGSLTTAESGNSYSVIIIILT